MLRNGSFNAWYAKYQSSSVRDVKKLMLAAEGDDAIAQLELGVCYLRGRGVQQDYNEAIKWLELAADQGDAVAQYKLGSCYEKGRGVPRDRKKAVEWYELAAKNGHPEAEDRIRHLVTVDDVKRSNRSY